MAALPLPTTTSVETPCAKSKKKLVWADVEDDPTDVVYVPSVPAVYLSQQVAPVSKSSDPLPTTGKETKSEAKLSTGMVLLRSAPSRARAPRGKVMTVKMTLRGSMSSANATANIFGVGLTPSSYGEWTELKALYDEVKVVSQDLYFSISTVAPGIPVWGGVAYSPGSYAPTSVANVAQNEQMRLFATNVGTYSATLCTSPLATNPTGLHHIKFTVPKGSYRSSSVATDYGGQWSSVADTGDCYGSAVFYVESAGTGQATTVSWLSVINCQYRVRG